MAPQRLTPSHDQTQEVLERADRLFDEAEQLQKQARAELANHFGSHRKDQRADTTSPDESDEGI